jgi:hypothetical protein
MLEPGLEASMRGQQRDSTLQRHAYLQFRLLGLRLGSGHGKSVLRLDQGVIVLIDNRIDPHTGEALILDFHSTELNINEIQVVISGAVGISRLHTAGRARLRLLATAGLFRRTCLFRDSAV